LGSRDFNRQGLSHLKVAGVLAVETAARKTKPAVAGSASNTSESATADLVWVAAILIAKASVGSALQLAVTESAPKI
jgi:hypothetical protein